MEREKTCIFVKMEKGREGGKEGKRRLEWMSLCQKLRIQKRGKISRSRKSRLDAAIKRERKRADLWRRKIREVTKEETRKLEWLGTRKKFWVRKKDLKNKQKGE